MSDHARGRVLAAFERAVARKGYGLTSVADVLNEGRLARTTFYEHFTGKEDCFLQSYERAVEQLIASALTGYRLPADTPDERMRVGMRHTLSWIAERPLAARLHFIDVHAVGPAGHAARVAVLHELAGLVECMTDGLDLPRMPSPNTHEAVVGGMHAVIFSRLLNRREEELVDMADDMVDWILLTYGGLSHPARTPRPSAG